MDDQESPKDKQETAIKYNEKGEELPSWINRFYGISVFIFVVAMIISYFFYR